ncbi:MAG: dihydrodipicolinate synthase family protein [Planctomycetota bacterium]|jgi:4-hydroxy-tetrahydrodipicolinate synthase|nr:dihydrodipicolinate synthase family protein [Planctomycetota bacterium]MDP7254155.1 dihydrodipicolinate synthase family protein [Planctomycetota bacterium]
MPEKLRGIFPVLQTPLDAGGEIDFDSLRGEVAFCIATGAHGLVFPVLGSEFQYFSDRERRSMVETVVIEAAGQIPVVAGVAGTSTPSAAEHAHHGSEVGADAVIALPPFLSSATPEETNAYYRAISDAAGIPVFVQHTNPGLSPSLIARMVTDIEHVRYIKEEAGCTAHTITAVVDAVDEECWGVFGGAWGRWMISETRRGATGFMPGAPTPEVYVQIWEALEAGDESSARRIFDQLLPLINFNTLVGLQVCKEVLVRRGVFKTSKMRTPGSIEMDEDDHRELDAILEQLNPLLRSPT